MNIVLGTEVYVTKYLFNNENIKGINYGNSKYILTEFPYNATFSDNSYEMLDRLMSEQGLIPVIPHVERYSFLVDNPDVIEDLKRLGVVIQTNISNYTKKAPMMKRRRMLKLVSAGLIDIIGTDAHSFDHNTPELYSDAIECIAKKCGRQAVDRLMKNSEKIFNAAIV
jgi:protein-tyrosine phosphatase